METTKFIFPHIHRHSPEPWRINAGGFTRLVDADGNDIVHYTTEDDGLHIDNPADALLICAAPDLLRACNELLQALRLSGYREYTGSESRIISFCVDNIIEAVNKATTPVKLLDIPALRITFTPPHIMLKDGEEDDNADEQN